MNKKLFILLIVLISLMSLAHNVTLANRNEKTFTAVKGKDGTVQLGAAEVEKKLKEIRARIKQARLGENGQTAERFNIEMDDIRGRTAKLWMLQGALERLLTVLKKRAAIKKEATLLGKKSKLEQHAGISEKPPYSLSFYDRLLDEPATAERQKKATRLAVSLDKKSLEESELKVKKTEKKWRGLREQLKGGTL